MKKLPSVLLIVAALGLLVGLIIRIAVAVKAHALLTFVDPQFCWRGAMAFLALAIGIVLIQIRDK